MMVSWTCLSTQTAGSAVLAVTLDRGSLVPCFLSAELLECHTVVDNAPS